MESKLVWHLWPEEFPREDKGCELPPACRDRRFLTAGKEPWGQQVFSKSRRPWRIMDLEREGKSVKEIALRFEVRPRRVQRSLNAITSQDLKVGTDK